MLIIKSTEYWYSGRDSEGRHRFRRKFSDCPTRYEMITVDQAKFVMCTGNFKENHTVVFDRNKRPLIPKVYLDPEWIKPSKSKQDDIDYSQFIDYITQGTS